MSNSRTVIVNEQTKYLVLLRVIQVTKILLRDVVSVALYWVIVRAS